MFRYYFLLFVAAIVLNGCGWGSAENTNSANTNRNVNAENVNSSSVPPVADEKVPKFDDAQEALAKGIEYLDANKFEFAIDALKQAVELDEDLADAHFQLGVAYSLKESEAEKTVAEEEPAEEETSKKPAKEKEKKLDSEIAFENAIKAYKKIIAKDSKDHAAYFNLGRAYLKIFDDTEARKALERAVKLNEEDTNYRTELGAVLIRLAQYPEAIKQLNKAIDLDEANYRADDLLTKATAGRKRVDFAQKEKASSTSSSSSSSSSSPSSSDNSKSSKSKSSDSSTPEPKNDKPKAEDPKPSTKKPSSTKKDTD
jgi:tetratricopeptide (TPR) repeat protein